MDPSQLANAAGMGGGMDGSGMGAPPSQNLEGGAISLSAQAELELELSLRGSLLVQQQRRIVQLEDELQRAWAEIERLRTKLGALERERQPNDEDGSRAPRYWTPEEHTLFVEAVQRYGWKDVKAISQHVGTRNPTQVRTHAQKLLLRQQKEQAGVMQTQQNGRELPPLPPGMIMSANDGGQLLNMLGNPPAPAGDAEGISAGEPAAAPAEADLSALPPAPADAGSAAPVEAS
jgi:SHAQKYF class myb-like DNA-binding protein